MASVTNPQLEQQIMYSVFVRNHSKEGSFDKVIEDLDRIRDLGTDILWLMPVNPTGKVCRKGKDGSPYAIADYRKIEPSMGTWQDLKRLADEAHKRGMKVIVDVVFNHTSPDSRLWKDHPEWFYQDENGNPHSLVEDWSDIIDLDYSHPELQEELIDTLKQYAAILDGFRCDVASRIPVSFWKKARAACAEVNPDLIWLAESCHLPFIKFIRDNGRVGESDSSLYEAFDVLYDYDAFPYCQKIFEEHLPMQEWVDALIRQDASLPPNAIKLRFLENHDNDRIAQYVKDPVLWKNWTALLFTLKGLPLLYHGQEQRETHRPSIFDQDVIHWKKDEEAENWIRKMASIHHHLFQSGSVIDYVVDEQQHILEILRDQSRSFFLLDLPETEKVRLNLEDGTYTNLFTDQPVTITNRQIDRNKLPLLIQSERG